mmetsp:Transcript_35072/g.88253  ORF Transcript_35072/g.88253 Transcript_35072/m.88253 type:complete len:434 (-) Transcript_35072:458-1759(-)
MASEKTPVVVVGASCRVGTARTLRDLWRVHMQKESLAVPAPPGRFLPPGCPAVVPLAGAGGLCAAHFNLAPAAAAEMTPSERLSLELAWEAFHCAGFKDLASVKELDCSVTASCSENGTTLECKGNDKAPDDHVQSASFVAGRVAFVLNLTGPALTVDAGCTSFLNAVDLASQQLVLGRCEYALVVSTSLSHRHSVTSLARLNLVSKKGASLPFQTEADGYVPSEGGGAVLLTLPKTAERDGRAVHGTVRSVYANSGGPRWNLVFPHRAQMQECMFGALDYAGLKPFDIDLLELQATALLMSDEVEFSAVREVYQRYDDDPPRSHPVAVGTHTGNVGHLANADAAVSFIKALLSLSTGTVPPNLIKGSLNPAYPFFSLPATLAGACTSLIPPSNRPLFAAVNAFSANGTNAHAVLQAPAKPTALLDTAFAWPQ